MKINSFLVLFLFLVFKSNAQKIYAVDHASQADVKVFVADYQSQADLLVYKVHYASQLGKNDGIPAAAAIVEARRSIKSKYGSGVLLCISFVGYHVCTINSL